MAKLGILMNVTVTFRPSIRRIAEDAGVSRTTVSRVLNGHAGEFSDETRQRVLDVVRELNYIPVAQPTIQSRRIETHIIGVLFDGLDMDEYWSLPTIYRGMRETAADLDYDLLTLLRRKPPHSPEEREEIRFLDRRCDAFVFIVPLNRYTLMETLVSHGIPVVSYAVDDVPPGVGYVVGDNEHVMGMAVRHLVEHGHRHIGHLGQPADRSYFRQRQAGFRAAMSEAGLDPDRACIMEKNAYPCTDAVDRMVQLAARGEITAVACASDHFALLLWDRAEAMGLRVPRDLSIVGVDDIPEAAHRGLTSFRVDNRAAGRAMIEATVAALAGAIPWQKIQTEEIVSRCSVAEPRQP